MTKRKVSFRFLTSITLTLLVFGLLIGLGANQFRGVLAAENESEIVDIRIIGTTDLHGQLNSNDYELGVDYNNGGLARVFDLIKKTKAELPKNNTIILDTGDVLFDYTTEYIFSSNQEAIQPIYQAMKYIGYDAITLGNHEFDYGYDYILRQLDGSGLRDITVVSNVTDARTGDYPFLENMLITRYLTTKSGKEVEVKIGIIGQTIPHMTGKTHSYVGILTGEDMVANAKTQSAKLKEMGADVIIALSHTGIGPENPEINFKNVAYALTKIPDIDVVIAGHEHNLYPTTDKSSAYYKLPGVDKETYLMNGKNVVMAGDRGKAIGIVDLALEIKGDTVRITNRKSSLRMVTEKNTVEDPVVAAMFGEWEEQLKHYASDVLAKLEPDTALQNYYGLFTDNAAIQLLNDSKIHYALERIKSNEKKYIDYPIIAASTYESFGVKSIYDFVDIQNNITEANLTTLQNYNSYLYVYTIKGAQLLEWLEWSASAYETILRDTAWQDETMSSLMKETKLKSLIREDWLNDWSNFYVFDGISYDIDPSREPRYDFSGNRISSNKRVSNVTYNGKEVTDDMELLIATNKITNPSQANKDIDKQSVLRGFNRSQSILGKYISQLAKSGSILPQVDYNWNLILPYNYQFIVKLPYHTSAMFEKTPWYKKSLTQKDNYGYFVAEYLSNSDDTTAPHIVVAPLVTNPTASSYEIAVQAVDESEIKYFKYVSGDKNINYVAWEVANNVPSKGFSVHKNDTYTIYAEDIHGNKAVKKIIIDNFDDNLLPRPIVDNYTNRKQRISGKAEPNTILVIETPNNIYEQKINANGTFSVALPGQLAETYISLYVRDDERGLESERVPVRINRTGPNQPLISPMYNNVSFLTGNARENVTSVIAIIDNLVYVSDNGGRQLFEANKEIYDPSLKIVETLVHVSFDGQFVIMLPPQKDGTSINVYAIDHVSRNSRVSTTTVKEAAPNAPIVYEVSNIEKSIVGYVPSSSNINVELHIADKVYTTKTDNNGRFSYTFNDQLYAGQSLLVIASDIKDGKERHSYPVEVIVNDIESYVRSESTNLILNRVTDKSNLISGFYYAGGTVNIAFATGEGENFLSRIYSTETDESSRFVYYLDEKVDIGTKIYAMVRFVDGRILLARSFTVTAGRPDMPMLLNEISNTDKVVKVISIKDCEIALTIGKKLYTTREYVYDEANDQYIYTLATDRDLSGTRVTVTASNDSGTSDALVTQLVKASPDSPTVNTVYEGDKTIKGTIELLDYVIAQEEGTETEVKLPKEFKNAASEVAKTQTRVYAQIGTKTYKGTIDNKGNFTIDIPEQAEGTPIRLWGTNKAGRGPLVKIVVIKK
ncbi:MAG: hypothetical protein GX129_08925 [Clostridiales bacterium]|nr:hypothetical protein [Clostridiales bacterium]